jgi:hypothetical protein
MTRLILNRLFNLFIARNIVGTERFELETPAAEKRRLFFTVDLTTADRSFCVTFGKIA